MLRSRNQVRTGNRSQYRGGAHVDASSRRLAVKALALGTALALSTSQAYALSCAQPNVERSFNTWVESEDTYYIGVGTLTPLEEPTEIPNALQLGGGLSGKGPYTAKYMFSGELLDADRSHPYEMPITVTVTCAGPWCGGFPKSGTSGLMALRGVGIQNLTLDMHACPGSVFPAQTRDRVSECMRDGKCIP